MVTATTPAAPPAPKPACAYCGRVGGCSHDPKHQRAMRIMQAARIRELRLREAGGVMDEFEREHEAAQNFFEAQQYAALSFNRAWAHFRLADAIVLGRSGATVRVIEDPDSLVPVRRVSGGVLRG